MYIEARATLPIAASKASLCMEIKTPRISLRGRGCLVPPCDWVGWLPYHDLIFHQTFKTACPMPGGGHQKPHAELTSPPRVCQHTYNLLLWCLSWCLSWNPRVPGSKAFSLSTRFDTCELSP